MRNVISVRTGMFWKVGLFVMLWVGGGLEGYAAGEGTIPLRVTGKVIGTDAPRFVSNAEATMDITRSLSPEAIHCLSGKQAKRYLARGKFNLRGRMQQILAVCVEESGESIELFTEDEANQTIYRIIGKARTVEQSQSREVLTTDDISLER